MTASDVEKTKAQGGSPKEKTTIEAAAASTTGASPVKATRYLKMSCIFEFIWLFLTLIY